MRKTSLLWAFLLFITIASTAHASLRVGSWNIRHFGWGKSKNEAAVAAVVSRFDIVALLEVMDPAAVKRLEKRLESQTNSEWASVASRAIGRGSYKEHYAFIWREKEVSFEGGAAVYLDPGDVFAREPLSAVFADRDDGQRFVFAAVHILYGDGVADRTPEIRALDDYRDWLVANFDAPVILAGDFNLAPGHPAWRELRSGAKPLIRRGASTLSSHDSQYANLYDNLWVADGDLDITGHGIARFPEWLGITHKQARKQVSDHAPVYLTIGNIAISTATIDQSGRGVAIASRTGRVLGPDCVDLNTASIGRLDTLEHIGPARAKAIVAGRPWQSVADLKRIRGLGAARVRDIERDGQVCR